MPEFNAVVAHIEGEAWSGRIQALEGGRGILRIVLDMAGPGGVREGGECVLEMHDGARFRVSVQERLAGEGEWRVKLIGKA